MRAWLLNERRNLHIRTVDDCMRIQLMDEAVPERFSSAALVLASFMLCSMIDASAFGELSMIQGIEHGKRDKSHP